jgi:hypothetical protein
MWMRTLKRYVSWDDFSRLTTDKWDALKFRAKRNVYFCGFGMTKTYESQDFELEMKLRIMKNDTDDIEPTIIEVNSTTSPVNE